MKRPRARRVHGTLDFRGLWQSLQRIEGTPGRSTRRRLISPFSTGARQAVTLRVLSDRAIKPELLLRELIALASVNPAFLAEGHARAGEQRVADFLAST